MRVSCIFGRVPLVLFLGALLVAIPSRADVGLYADLFDPVTTRHRDRVLEAMAIYKLDHIYLSVIPTSVREPNTSVDERVDMLKLAFMDFQERVTILPEPLEGNAAYAQYLRDKQPGRVLGILGDELFGRNFLPAILDADPELDGLSARAREMVGDGVDPVDILDERVISYVKQQGVYQPMPEEKIAHARSEFVLRFRSFLTFLRDRMPKLQLDKIAVPTFKSSQSLAAQNDKYIRRVVEHLKLSLPEEIEVRRVCEEILGYSSRSTALRSPQKIGVYPGEFDLFSNTDRRALEAGFAHLGFGRVFVVVLEHPDPSLPHTIEERLKSVRDNLRDFGDRIRVVTAPSLDELATVVRGISADYEQGSTLILSGNVFEDNYRRMKGIPHTSFVVVPHPDQPKDLPPGVTEIDVRLDPNSSESCPAKITDVVSEPELAVRIIRPDFR